MVSDFDYQDELTPMPRLIACVGLLLLVTAWWTGAGLYARPGWTQLGAFGLVAGIGLTLVDRERQKQRLQEEYQLLERRLEREAARFLPHRTPEGRS
jgi:hypothetical protein